ncbi:hypothetical protein ILYODFUR_019471 [Ilyodon furcidens]|uniref:Uncharacterized protein n=1 Tax=Ilyodon furcidens TaxID=33524 RepID=A0ABV0TW03_9TELE
MLFSIHSGKFFICTLAIKPLTKKYISFFFYACPIMTFQVYHIEKLVAYMCQGRYDLQKEYLKTSQTKPGTHSLRWPKASINPQKKDKGPSPQPPPTPHAIYCQYQTVSNADINFLIK